MSGQDLESDAMPAAAPLVVLEFRGRHEIRRPTFAILDIRLMGDLCDVFYAESMRIREAEERGDAVGVARGVRVANDAARELRERAYAIAAAVRLPPEVCALWAPDEPEEAATDAAVEFVAALRSALNARLADRGKFSPR